MESKSLIANVIANRDVGAVKQSIEHSALSY